MRTIEEVAAEIDALSIRAEDTDAYQIQEALREAAAAARNGNYGIGSVIVHRGEIVGRAGNARRQAGPMKAVAHAEVLSIANAYPYFECHAPEEGRVVATLEACMSCTGAIINAHLGESVSGAADPGGGMILSAPGWLPPDFDAIWKKHGMTARLAEIPENLRRLCW